VRLKSAVVATRIPARVGEAIRHRLDLLLQGTRWAGRLCPDRLVRVHPLRPGAAQGLRRRDAAGRSHRCGRFLVLCGVPTYVASSRLMSRFEIFLNLERHITISSPPRIAQAGLGHASLAMTNVDADEDQDMEHDALANCRERSRGCWTSFGLHGAIAFVALAQRLIRRNEGTRRPRPHNWLGHIRKVFLHLQPSLKFIAARQLSCNFVVDDYK
jgi:hypothetical protein